MKIFIFILLTAALTAAATPAHAAVSNRIDATVINELITKKKIWDDSFDDENSPAGKSLLAFLTALSKGQTALIVDNLFSFENGKLAQNLYRAKMAILHSHPSYPQHAPKVMARYVDGLVNAVKLSGITDFDPILATFKSELASGRLTLTDLSPSERARLARTLGSAHGISITDQDASGYLVNGLFHDATGTFAVDISRPITDNLITFAHEVVHVGHPDVVRARATFPALQTEVQNILERWSKVGLAQLPGLIRILSYELNQADLDVLQKKLAQRRVAPSASSDVRTAIAPTAEEEAKVRAWADSLIAVTVASEFHAYGLSLSLYATLKDRLDLLPPARHMRQFLNALMTGDEEFARLLQYQGFTFSQKRDALHAMYEKLSLEQRAQVTAAMNRVEGIYLQRFDEFLRSTSNRYSTMLQQSSSIREPEAAMEILPVWARPGGWNSPLNPANILFESISTAEVDKMRLSLDWASTQLKTFSSTLLNFRTGILDFSNLTLGELRLMGFASGQFTLPSSVQQAFAMRPDLMADVNTIPASIQQEFQLLNDGTWCRTSFCTVSSQSVISRYIALLLLRANLFAADLIPVTSMHGDAIRVMLDKIAEGRLDEDLTKDRAQELKQKLTEQYNDAKLLPNEVQWMRAMLFRVVNFHQASIQVELRDLADRFDRLSRRLLTVLSKYGHDTSLSFEQIEAQVTTYQAQFRDQLQPFASECSRVDFRWWNEDEQRKMLSATGGSFRLGEAEFLLSMVCRAGQMYLVRQPGDYKKALPTIVSGGQVVSSLLIGGQPLQLVPATALNPDLFTTSTKKRSSWSN
jgi:hypothetical protein